MAPRRGLVGIWAAAGSDIFRQLKDFDPEEQPGERVQELPFGTRRCPTCGGALVELGLIPTPESESFCVLECASCDSTFCERPEALLQ
jgi:hypothetical protein